MKWVGDYHDCRYRDLKIMGSKSSKYIVEENISHPSLVSDSKRVLIIIPANRYLLLVQNISRKQYLSTTKDNQA